MPASSGRTGTPALRHVDFFPGLLNRMLTVLTYPLNGGDADVFNAFYRRQAATNGFTVAQYRAGAALANTATEFRHRTGSHRRSPSASRGARWWTRWRCREAWTAADKFDPSSAQAWHRVPRGLADSR